MDRDTGSHFKGWSIIQNPYDFVWQENLTSETAFV